MPKVNILSPHFYIPNFLKIRNKNAELVNFTPNPAQLRLRDTIDKLRSEDKPVRIIILKARQMGFSTYTEAECFHQTVTNKYFNSTIIAHEDSASQNLYNMFKTYYDNLPQAIKPMRKRNNAKELLFENPTGDDLEKTRNPGLQSSVKVATAKNTATGRSQTIHFLHCSEVAFWDNPKETVTGLFQCVPYSPKTTIIIESTANGVGDYFYECWNDAVNGRNDFIPLFFAWFEHSEYEIPFISEEEKEHFIEEVNYTYNDAEGNVVHTEEYELMQQHSEITYEKLKWRRWCIANNCYGDVEKFHQEYPSTPEEAFISSGRPRFNTTVLKQYMKNSKEGDKGDLVYKGDKVIFVPNPKGYLEIWKYPQENEYYCVGGDVAEGKIDGDYSVGIVGDNSFDICCMWRGHIDPDLFGHEMVKLAKFYNDGYLGIENNFQGLTPIKAILSDDYYNIYYTKNYDKITDTVTQSVGWRTTNRTKPLMINKLAEYIRNKWIGVKSKTIISEMLTYVIDDKGSFNAQSGCHDDTVMATAIMLQLLLEGKSDTFVPYKADEDEKEKTYTRLGMKFRRDEDIDEECSLEMAR